MDIKESSKDWWPEVEKRMESIQDGLFDGTISSDEAIDQLNELLMEIIMTEKLEQNVDKEERFQYDGIKF